MGRRREETSFEYTMTSFGPLFLQFMGSMGGISGIYKKGVPPASIDGSTREAKVQLFCVSRHRGTRTNVDQS